MTRVPKGIIIRRIRYKNVGRGIGIKSRHLQSLRYRNYTCHVHSSLSNEEPMDYTRGWAWQQILLNRRLQYQRKSAQCQSQLDTADGEGEEEGEAEDHLNVDRILLLEHKPVYTLGRGASEDHLTFLDEETKDGIEAKKRLSRKARGKDSCRLAVDRIQHVQSGISPLEEVNAIQKPPQPVLAPNGAPIYRIERGGEVTFHGPGQLIVYPLLDLRCKPYQQDLHWYLRSVEEVIIQTLGEYGIEGVRDDINTGVWVDSQKIAAVGVSSSRWITTHGFALNISPQLEYFDTSLMIPCGIEGRDVTSLAKVLQERGDWGGSGEQEKFEDAHSLVEISKIVLNKFENVFGIRVETGGKLE